MKTRLYYALAAGLLAGIWAVTGSTACAETETPALEEPQILYESADDFSYVGEKSFGVYARADALIMKRNSAHANDLVVDSNGNVVLTTNDPNFRYVVGPQITVGVQLNDCSAIEGRYFGLLHWVDGAGFAGPGFMPFADGAAPAPFFTNNVATSYTSDLHSAEVNYRRDVTHWLAILGGMRWLQIDENFDIAATSPIFVPLAYNIETDNNLAGIQLGGEVNIPIGCKFNLRAFARNGAYVNFNEQQNVLGQLGAAPVRVATNRETSIAYVGEAGVSAGVQVIDGVWIRGGYQVMWITGVALAPEQVDLNLASAGTSVKDGGDAFYHGATAGIEITYGGARR